MYTGSAGNAYIYWRLYLYAKRTEKAGDPSKHLDEAIESYEANVKLIEQKKSQSECNSFYISEVGLHTIGAILYKEKGNKEKVDKCFEKVLSGLDLYDSG